MINQKFGLAMALALSLGVGSVQAGDFKSYISKGQCGTSATLIDDGDVITKSLEYAVEQFGTTDVGLDMPFRVRYTLAKQLTDQFYVTYTLSGGATWGKSLTTSSFVIQSADGSAASGAPLVAIVQGGKDTESTVSFIVQAGTGAPATLAHILDFQFTVGKAQKALANYGQISVAMDLRVAATAQTNPTSGTVADTAKTLPLATSKSGATIQLSPPTPNSGAYISVAGDGKIFEGPSITSTTAVDYGNIKIANAGSGLSKAAILPNGGSQGVVSDTACQLTSAYWDPCAAGTLTSVKLSISDGNFIASTIDKIFIETGSSGTPIPATEKLDDNITAKWTITDTTQLAALCTTTRDIMLNVDGVTEINENRKVKPTGTLTVEFAGGKIINSSTKLRHLKKNGSVCTLYNIPNSAALDRLNIRITNDSTVSGFVKGTLRGEDGIDIFKGAILIPADGLVPNQTVHLDTAAIIAAAVAAGKTEWPGRAVLTVESNIPEGYMEAYGLLRAATQPLPTFTDSPLMNMSVGTTGDGCD